MTTRSAARFTALLLLMSSPLAALFAAVPVDRSGFSPDSGIIAREDPLEQSLEIRWPIAPGEHGVIVFNLSGNGALLKTLGLAQDAAAQPSVLLDSVDPVFFLTVGSRQAPAGRPPAMPVWNVFFDNPSKRPHQVHASRLRPSRARVSSEGRRVKFSLDEIMIGPFEGGLEFTCHPDSRLLQVEAIVSTDEDRRAILYDAGLAGDFSRVKNMSWLDTEGQWQSAPCDSGRAAEAVAVRHRAIIAESAQGAIACFPPPHQFHFPRDWTDNLKFAWFGKAYRNSPLPFGFGVRQEPDGKRAFEPWFNAPPGTRQRLGVFFVLARGGSRAALRETLRFTREDRFPAIPGHVTFTSHYHMAVAIEGMRRQFQGTPDFVTVFKEMGVQAVHIADFHGDGHPKDTGAVRLSEVEAMIRECRRLSGSNFLLVPGEELNEYLGISEPGKHPGHWMTLFPKPVFWTQKRAPGQPFREDHPTLGAVYHVGDREDMVRLLQIENGLAWTAHPRIKASSWAPDIFRNEAFYLADFWLGAAWKAMPADLSRERLGERCLDLLDDMANWGQRKYLPGEVDVFKIDHTHELYGHMNINYLRLDRLPRFDDGWQPVLAALRAGKFFTTTGEILIRRFTVGGKQSGEALEPSNDSAELLVELDWTFPLKFYEIISGDGEKVYRQRFDTPDETAFHRRVISVPISLRGRKWVRFEAWDIAANGAYTQPVWIGGN